MFTHTNGAFAGIEHQPFHWDAGRNVALLVHGFPGTPAEMRPVAEILHNLGWTVRAVLLPGFGSDISNMLNRTHHDWLGSVGAELAQLRRQYDKVMLVGFSMGGALSINLAALHQLDGLMLFSPFVEVKHVLWKVLPAIRLFIPRIKIFKLFKPNFSDPQTRDSIRNFMPKVDLDDPNVQRDILDFELPISMFDEIRTIGQKGAKVAPQLNLPIKIFQGLQDELVQPNSTRQLIQSMNSHVEYTEVNAPHEIINTDLPDWMKIQAKITHYAARIAAVS